MYVYAGGPKAALVQLLTVILSELFICTPFPLRILLFSRAVPWSTFHPPNASNLYRFKRR